MWGPLLKLFNNAFSEFWGVLIAMNLFTMLHSSFQKFFFGVGGKRYGTFHIARVVSTIYIIAFHDIFLPLIMV